MKSIIRLVASVSIATLSASSFSQTCYGNKTYTPATIGQAITALGSAPKNSVICLGAGTYPVVNLSGLRRTTMATLASKTMGTAAIGELQMENSSHIRVTQAAIGYAHAVASGGGVNCSDNLILLNNPFAFQGGLYLNQDGCGASNIVIDGNSFVDGSEATYEGRLSLIHVDTVTVQNNVFQDTRTAAGGGSRPSPSDYADGIFMGGVTSHIAIGPNNVFAGIIQADSDNYGTGNHIDPIQIYGTISNVEIFANTFTKNSTVLMAPDGGSNVNMHDNVIDNSQIPGYCGVQFGSAVSPIFNHNTMLGECVTFDRKHQTPQVAQTTNALVTNNLFADDWGYFVVADPSDCVSCTFNKNQFTNAANVGTSQGATSNPVICANPTFVGTAAQTPPFAAHADYKVAPSAGASCGYSAGLDGKSLGITQ